jgi:hypothetical protein
VQFIDQIRQTTNKVKAEQAKEALAKAKREYDEKQRLKSLAIQEAVDVKLPEVRKAIEEAAAEGQNSARYEMFHWVRDRVQLDAGYNQSYELKRILEGEGFKVSLYSVTNDPSGSDSYFAHTCYDLYLDITW